MADAIGAHERALRFGGLPGVLSQDLVEAALARPYNGYYRSIEQKSAALVQSMAGNHGFADGNKRTTLILVQTLLTRSGYDLLPANQRERIDDAAEQMILDTVMGRLSFDDIANWFRARIRRRRPPSSSRPHAFK